MASFFQPGLVTFGVANNTRFLVYGNSVLEAHDLTAHWYQIAIISAAGVAFFAAFLIVVVQSWEQWREKFRRRSRWTVDWKWLRRGICMKFWRKRSRDEPKSVTLTEKPSASESDRNDTETLKTDARSSSLEAAKSFGFCSDMFEDTANYDLVILQYSSLQRGRQDSATAQQSPSEGWRNDDDRCWLAFDLKTSASILGKESDAGCTPAGVILLEAKDYKRIILFLSDEAVYEETTPLLIALRALNIMVIIASDPDNPVLHRLNFENISGTIFTNACVLPNGQFRDFFRQARLRKALGRCARQQKSRNNFFVGFLELYSTQRPSAAVARRASKLAEFFGALFQIAHVTNDGRIVTELRKDQCLSAFDWLKNPEVVEVCITLSIYVHCSFPS